MSVVQLRNHVLAIDKMGQALDIDQGGTVQDMDAYLQQMFAAMDAVTDGFGMTTTDAESGVEKQVRRILIHVHGGLNTHKSAKKTAQEVTEKMLNEEDANRYYPFFVAWPAGGASCYLEHLFTLRQGRRSKGIGRLLFVF